MVKNDEKIIAENVVLIDLRNWSVFDTRVSNHLTHLYDYVENQYKMNHVIVYDIYFDHVDYKIVFFKVLNIFLYLNKIETNNKIKDIVDLDNKVMYNGSKDIIKEEKIVTT